MNGCEWLSLRSALARFVNFGGATQSQRHIKPRWLMERHGRPGQAGAAAASTARRTAS